MTTPDLERRLTDLLQERAENAMERTRTQERLSALLADGQHDVRRRRRRVVTGGLAAAAVAATVAVAAWVASGGEKETAPEPAPAPDSDLSAAVATVFVDRVYAYEPVGTALMADDVVIEDAPSVEAWLADYWWREAAGFTLADLSCRKGVTTAEGTEVRCAFAFHALGSKQLGRGPFGDNTFDVVVQDDQVTEVDETLAFIENGFSEQVWEPFAAWVADRHPADVEVMYTDAEQSGASFQPRSLRLWEQRISEWVALELERP